MKKELEQNLLSQVKNAYQTIADDFANKRQYHWPIMELFADYIKEGNNVLDWGCAHGRFFKLIRDKQISYLGIDNCKSLLQKAQAQYPEAVWTDDPIIKENNFDIIIALASWHHLPGVKLRQQKLDEFYNGLKSGGYLLLTSWNFKKRSSFLFWLKNNIRNVFSAYDWNDILEPWQLRDKVVSRYYHHIGKRELMRLAKKSGFVVEKCFYEYQGKKVSWLNGNNLVLVAKK